MTFNEVKKLLENWRSAEIKAVRLKRRLNALKEDYDGLRAQTYDGCIKPLASSPNSIQERVVIKIETASECWSKALERVFDLEDKISNAIDTLSESEQNIIIGYYLESKTHDKLARECHYCEKQIRRKKNAAIEKISKII